MYCNEDFIISNKKRYKVTLSTCTLYWFINDSLHMDVFNSIIIIHVQVLIQDKC